MTSICINIALIIIRQNYFFGTDRTFNPFRKFISCDTTLTACNTPNIALAKKAYGDPNHPISELFYPTDFIVVFAKQSSRISDEFVRLYKADGLCGKLLFNAGAAKAR